MRQREQPRTTNETPPLLANPVASTDGPNLHPPNGDVVGAMSPPRWLLPLAPVDPQSDGPATDNTVPPISPRFFNTTLNMTDTPGVMSPLRIPDWVTEPINAMHSSW